MCSPGSLGGRKGKSTSTKLLSSPSSSTRTRSYKEGREVQNRKCTVHSRNEDETCNQWKIRKAKKTFSSPVICVFTGSPRNVSFVSKESTSQRKYYTQHADLESMNEQRHPLFWLRLHTQPDSRFPQIETQSRSETAGKRPETKIEQTLIPRLLLCVSKPRNQDEGQKKTDSSC